MDDQHTQWAAIMRFQHVLEKALSFREPRVGFGAWAVEGLLCSIRKYNAMGYDRSKISGAYSALNSYLEMHRKRHAQPPLAREIVEELDRANIHNDYDRDAVISVRRSEIQSAAVAGFAAVVSSRHSIRQFAIGAIPPEDISKAVAMAQRSPSVCNRQCGRVHVISDPGLRAKILDIQGGNRGFGDQASHAFVVTADLGCMLAPVERHQAYIDGGMFGMTLVYALHSMGYGTCCLHWSVECSRDRALRRIIPVRQEEEVIFLVAAGKMPEDFSVARSERRALSEVLFWH